MKLSKEHIEKLYQFTQKHYVEWYDLQTELVDHLANGIEQQWETNPNIGFEDALQKEFKKFGVFGFMEVVEQRQKALSKRYFKIMLGFIKEWFRLPKIIATTTLAFALFLILKSSSGQAIYFGILITVTVFVIVKSIKIRKTFNLKTKANGKKWLFEEMIFKTAAANAPVFMVNMYNMHLFSDTIGNWYVWLLTFTVLAILLTSYITLEVIPKNAEKYLKEIYPEYNLV